MSWETRNGGGRYYTRSRRRKGRVVREYLGAGEVATLMAQIDAVDRAKRDAELEARRKRRARTEALDANVAAFCNLAELFGRAALVVAGFRRHHRGEWRKSRAIRSSSK